MTFWLVGMRLAVEGWVSRLSRGFPKTCQFDTRLENSDRMELPRGEPLAHAPTTRYIGTLLRWEILEQPHYEEPKESTYAIPRY